MCSICLEGKSNVYTLCKHYFHLKCIYEWASRKFECPLCKSNKIKNISIYCQKCLRGKKEVCLKELPFLGVQPMNVF